MLKIGRNESCPCGSGKKFKKCCLGKTYEERLAESMADVSSTIKRDARIKWCLYPNKENCSSTIVRAHAIQNNRILNQLAVNGCVVSMDGTTNLIFQDAQRKGKKSATTFTGFCGYHDKVLFQCIEDFDFAGDIKQIFMWTYRTFAWHYHKKHEQINAHIIFEDKMKQKGFEAPRSIDYDDLKKGFLLAKRDNEYEKTKFNDYLLSESYENVSYSIWEIPYNVNFTVSMMNDIEHNIDGDQIGNYESSKPTKYIYLNIFPNNGKSYCIWSWLKDNDDVYKNYSQQFMELGICDRENYFNNWLPRWSDSIVISPRLWEIWGCGIQQAFIAHSNFDTLYRAIEKDESKFAYEYMDTPWNLFQVIPAG